MYLGSFISKSYTHTPKRHTKTEKSKNVSIKCLIYHSFLIHSFTNGHLGCFQHLAIVNYAAMNTGIHRFFWISVSGFLGYNPTLELLGQKVVPILVFWRNSILFSTVASPVCIPSNSALGSLLSTTSPALVCWFGYDDHPDWYEVVSHCGFNFHPSDG